MVVLKQFLLLVGNDFGTFVCSQEPTPMMGEAKASVAE
jgi:hypothetical protein